MKKKVSIVCQWPFYFYNTLSTFDLDKVPTKYSTHVETNIWIDLYVTRKHLADKLVKMYEVADLSRSWENKLVTPMFRNCELYKLR